MTLRQYLQVLRKRWLTAVTIALIALLSALTVTLLMPRMYAAEATSFVSLTTDGSGTDTLVQSSQFAITRVESYPQIVQSPDVLQSVIDELDLGVSVTELEKRISASNPTGTVLITVVARDGDPQRAKDLANAVSERLGQEIESLETPRAGGTAPVKVTNSIPAELPLSPVSPRPVLNLVLGMLVGVALGVAGAVLREQFDTTIRSPEELRSITGLSVLGSIRRDPVFRTAPLVALRAAGAGVEDFRKIRTTLQFVNVDRPPRQIVITSAVSNEGKTVTACNLAITMAKAEFKVCLVEGDLRKPKATSMLGLDGSLGLTDVVAGHYDLQDLLVPWNRGQLSVLPAGTMPPDPGQLLGSHAMENLLERLRSEFDLIVIDAPPLLPVSDAAVLAGASDGVILVARNHHVRREQLNRAIDSLRAVNATIIGAVLTSVPGRDKDAGYGDPYAEVSGRELPPPPPETAGPTGVKLGSLPAKNGKPADSQVTTSSPTGSTTGSPAASEPAQAPRGSRT